jgi:hypothetical protein
MATIARNLFENAFENVESSKVDFSQTKLSKKREEFTRVQ